MEIRELAAVAFTAVAAGTDLCSGKIYNWLAGAGCLLALLLSLFLDTPAESLDRLLGLLLPVLLLFALFAIGGLGGGDIKLLSMIGALLGWRAALMCMVYSAVLAAVFGGFWFCVCHVRGERLRYFLQCIRRSVLSRGLLCCGLGKSEARRPQENLPQRSYIHCAVFIMLGLWVRLEGCF